MGKKNILRKRGKGGQSGKWVRLLKLVNEVGQQKLIILLNYKLKFPKRIVLAAKDQNGKG